MPHPVAQLTVQGEFPDWLSTPSGAQWVCCVLFCHICSGSTWSGGQSVLDETPTGYFRGVGATRNA